MRNWQLDEIGRISAQLSAAGVSEDRIHKLVAKSFAEQAILVAARNAARATSIERYTVPVRCDVWMDPTRDEEVFMVRYPWFSTDHGVPHTREEFVRWFGEEAATEIAGAKS